MIERRSTHTTTKPLKRGKACLTCRFLKIKCDGERPICGPCMRSPKDDPCEYTDGPGRSRTKVLEETIARLEARIHELENPSYSTPPVELHDPYSSPPPGRPQALHLTPPVANEGLLAYSPSSPFSVTSTISTSSPPSAGSTSSSISPLTDVKLLLPDSGEDPSPATMRNLMDRFFAHAPQFGFFLDANRLYRGAFISPPYLGNHPNISRPTQGLLRTIFLWGAHLTPLTYSPEVEHELMLRALADTAINLAQDHPEKVIQTIQAEVLLAYYFFRIGRALEAKRHASSAAALTLGAGLHKLPHNPHDHPDSAAQPLIYTSSGPIYLLEPRTSVEEGERINAFWTVLALSKNLNVVFSESSKNVCGIFECPGLKINTPWPLDLESYAQGIIPPPTTDTMYNFLNGVKPEHEFYESSPNALSAKATILFHRAAYLASQFNPQLGPAQMQSFHQAFTSVDFLIQSLKKRLPRLDQLSSDPNSPALLGQTKTTCIAYASLYAASIKLHGLYAVYADEISGGASSREHCLSAAHDMLSVGEVLLSLDGGKDVGCVNPIVGALWASAMQVFVSEFNRNQTAMSYRSHQHQQVHPDHWRESPTSPISPSSPQDELGSNIQRCLAVLGAFATESVTIRYQLGQLQELYQGLSRRF